MDGGIIKDLKTSQAQKSAHTESFHVPELWMKTTLLSLYPSFPSTFGKLGILIKVLQSHHLHRAWEALFQMCSASLFLVLLPHSRDGAFLKQKEPRRPAEQRDWKNTEFLIFPLILSFF